MLWCALNYIPLLVFFYLYYAWKTMTKNHAKMFKFHDTPTSYSSINPPLYYTPLSKCDLRLFNSSILKIHNEFKSYCRSSDVTSGTLLSNGQTLGEYAIILIRMSCVAWSKKGTYIIEDMSIFTIPVFADWKMIGACIWFMLDRDPFVYQSWTIDERMAL